MIAASILAARQLAAFDGGGDHERHRQGNIDNRLLYFRTIIEIHIVRPRFLLIFVSETFVKYFKQLKRQATCEHLVFGSPVANPGVSAVRVARQNTYRNTGNDEAHEEGRGVLRAGFSQRSRTIGHFAQ
jgi:hypothetical protein